MATHEGIIDPIGHSKEAKTSNYTPSVVYPNRLKRKFHATAPQQKMVTDITYISDGTNFHYLSVIQDLFNNEIVAWQLSERNDVQARARYGRAMDKKKRRCGSRAPFGSRLPIYVSGVQHTIRSIRR